MTEKQKLTKLPLAINVILDIKMKIHLRTKPKITMGCLPALMVSGARKPKRIPPVT